MTPLCSKRSSMNTGEAPRRLMPLGPSSVIGVPGQEPPGPTGSAQGCITLKMMVGIPKALTKHRQASKRVRDLQLFGHAHPAMQLNRLLTDLTGGVRNFD